VPKASCLTTPILTTCNANNRGALSAAALRDMGSVSAAVSRAG
jgi:hypothetical protein